MSRACSVLDVPVILQVYRCEIRELFRDSVEKVAEVMEQQIRAARSKEGDPRFVTVQPVSASGSLTAND